MGMRHKAYAFDWRRFEADLVVVLREGLASNDAGRLRAWCHVHRVNLTDPYDGDPLPDDWEAQLEIGDVQEVADYALTAFYDVTADFGLGDTWLEVEGALSQELRDAFLGDVIHSANRNFDPGKMGSYFQQPSQVETSLSLLRSNAVPASQTFADHLEGNCVSSGLGLYVTF